MGRRALALGLAVGVTACAGGGEGEGGVPASTVRDSAGVTIVENAAPSATQTVGWTLDAEPAVSIGTLEGDERDQLFRVMGALVLPDGRIAIANRGTSEVRIYRPDGGYLDAWGAEGEGPGEFTGLSRIARWPGDSLLAWDFRQRRATVFAADGSLGRVFRVDGGDAIELPEFLAAFDDGSMLVRGSFVFTDGEAPTGMQRPPRVHGLADPAGSADAVYGEYPGDEMHALVTEQFVSVMTHPFGRRTATAVWNGLALISPSDRYGIDLYDRSGALVRSVRRAHEPRAPTQGDLDAYVASLLEEADEGQRARTERQFEEMSLVESLPAFDEVMVDALDHLWVREYAVAPEESTTWTVFDPEGRVLGRVETPEGAEVRDIGADYVLATVRDDFDVEYVRLWRLRR